MVKEPKLFVTCDTPYDCLYIFYFMSNVISVPPLLQSSSIELKLLSSQLSLPSISVLKKVYKAKSSSHFRFSSSHPNIVGTNVDKLKYNIVPNFNLTNYNHKLQT